MNVALRTFEDIKKLPQWVCYNKKKIPFSPLTGKGADCSNPDTWGTYEQAVTAWKNNPKWYVGVGFEFVKGQGITGIDLDHCIDEHGTIDQWAQKIIARFKSYCETSPSGTGIHIFSRGILPNHAGIKKLLPDRRHPKAAIEMYDSGRYFTVTGKRLKEAPLTIEERQETLDKLYAWLKQAHQKTPPGEQSISHPAPTSLLLNDKELLEKASSASNGEKFAALWRGDTSDYQGDESKADLALCTMLAFWTGKNALRIDRLFRQSGLMREKWDGNARTGETYGEGTITRAIAQCSDIYNPLEEPGRLKQQITSLLSLGKHQSKLPTGEQEARPTLITQKASELMQKKLPAVRWAVPDMLPEGFTLLAGKPKIGKSWAALNIGLGVASGGYVFGKTKVEAGRVLYLALEDNERRLQKRLSIMIQAMGGTIPDQFEYVLGPACPRLDAGGLELLENWIQRYPDARLILIDTWAKIAPRPRGRSRSLYDEEHDAMAPLQQLAATCGIAIVAIHHLRKTGSDSDVLDEISGSTGLIGAVDGFLVLKKDRGQFDAVLTVIGRDIEEEQALALSFEKTTALWTIQGKAEEFAKTKERQEILDLLKESPKGLGAKAIAETLKKNYHTTRNLLSKMKDAGQIEHKGFVYLRKKEKKEERENHSQKEKEKRNHRSQRSQRSHSNKVVSSSERTSPSPDTGSSSDDSAPDYGEDSAHQPVKPAQTSHNYGDYSDYATTHQPPTLFPPEQSDEVSDKEKSVSSVVTPVVLSHTTVVTPPQCCTVYEERLAEEHQPGTTLTTDSRGNPWCEKCEKQRELMDQGALTAYPCLTLSHKGQPLQLRAGEEQWFNFARKAGYTLVTEGLEAIRKLNTPDLEERGV